jgi:alkanesulfonate monooxygenase SsuD/methylene tetrahydromethanopterin reductase-like flavin-dependent oxidoreductase (luciferase family)
MRERMDVLAEQLEIVHDGHWGDDHAWSFHGEHYVLEGLDAQPRPVQRPHPPLIMGGGAGPRAARLAARFADEYNTVMPTLDEVRERRARIVAACEAAGRPPIPFSVMTGVCLGRDAAEAERRAEAIAERHGTRPDPATWITGTVAEGAGRLRELEAAGVERVYLQHLVHRDLEAVELIGREVAQALA